MRVSKTTNEIEFTAWVVFPTFGKRTIQTLNKAKQTTTFINIPFNYTLTTHENWFSITLSCILGIGISIKIKEKK